MSFRPRQWPHTIMRDFLSDDQIIRISCAEVAVRPTKTAPKIGIVSEHNVLLGESSPGFSVFLKWTSLEGLCLHVRLGRTLHRLQTYLSHRRAHSCYLGHDGGRPRDWIEKMSCFFLGPDLTRDFCQQRASSGIIIVQTLLSPRMDRQPYAT